MAPKRKPPSVASAASTTTPKPRRSKLAKENDLTAAEEAEIAAAFALFASPLTVSTASQEPIIATADVRRCLIALNCLPTAKAELQSLLSAVDPENEGWVAYEPFVAIAALQMHTKEEDPEGQREEVQRAFELFTRGEERGITVTDLRRVAGEIREDVPEAVLKDMVREAMSGGLGAVSLEEFEAVMRRAGVFG